MRKYLLFGVFGLFALQAHSQEIQEFCLENDAAHRYLNDFVYDSNDYTYTKITDYCDPEPYRYYKYDGYRKDQPLPVTLTWTANPDAVLQWVAVSEDPEFNDPEVYEIEKDASSIDIYNLIPQRTYYYKVQISKDGENAEDLVSSAFKTTGTLRMLKIDNIFNVRDMGGWIGLGGHPLKYGKLIRGSRMNVNKSTTMMITSDGIKELRRVGVKADLDLRDSGDAANVSTSFLGSDIPIKNINGAYKSRIATFANAPQSIQGIQQIIDWLKADKPVYFHCSVGADRTGTVAYLIGALCGMSENDLCKEFELTSFSADSIVTSGRQEDLRRRRTYEGRFDPNDDPASYQFATMVDKIKAFSGNTLQRKVYNHLKEGVSGTKISEADLDWLINYMVDYAVVKRITIDNGTSHTLQQGETFQIEAGVTPNTATMKMPIFTSNDTNVAKVSETGLVTAIRGGKATIALSADGIIRNVTITVPVVESKMPEVVSSGDKYYLPNSNLISNGSFEYAGFFTNWTAANEKKMNRDCFDVVNYEGSDSVYIQSKEDGNETSDKSIRTIWKIESGKTYVFGYKVKNSTDKQSVKNQYLETSLTEIKSVLNAQGDDFLWDDASQPQGGMDNIPTLTPVVFEYPTYDGNWTDVQYVFTNTEGYPYLQILFSHLSQGGNHTCFDNFYLSELTEATSVDSPKAATWAAPVYDLSGRQTDEPGSGIRIIDGKKYLYQK